MCLVILITLRKFLHSKGCCVLTNDPPNRSNNLYFFFRTVIFAMEGIGVVMPVENAMKKPQHFLGCFGVLVIAMTLIMILYTTLGLFGYLRYGDALRGSITLNLPIDEW